MQIAQQPASELPSAAPPRFVRWAATAVILLGLVFVALEWDQIRAALEAASFGPLPFAAAATVVSYFGKSMSFARLSVLLGVRMRTRELLPVGFISTVINHVVASGGAAGYSVRYALMSPHGTSFSQVVAVSTLHFVFTSVIMIGMLPVGLLILVSRAAIPSGVAQALTALAALVILATALMLALVLSSRLRSPIFNLLERLARRLLRREIGPTLHTFDATVAQAVVAMRKRPIEIVWLSTFIALDWFASVTVLWFGFRSLGVDVAPGTLISGFVIGVVAGVSSMVPGGLGVQEGTMAGVFALFGLDFDRAALAAVAYRTIYFILPYLISLIAYRWLLRRIPQEPS